MTRKRPSSKGWNIPFDQPGSNNGNQLSYGDDTILQDMEGYITTNSNSTGDSLSKFKSKRAKDRKYKDIHSGMYYHAQNPDEVSNTNQTTNSTDTMSFSAIQGISGLKANHEINRLNSISKNNIAMERLLLNQDIYNRSKTRNSNTMINRQPISKPNNEPKVFSIKTTSAKPFKILRSQQKIYSIKNNEISMTDTEKVIEDKIRQLEQENSVLRSKNKNLVTELGELEFEVQQYNEEVTKKLNDVTLDNQEIFNYKNQNITLTREKNQLNADLCRTKEKLTKLKATFKPSEKLKSQYKSEILHYYNNISVILRTMNHASQLMNTIKLTASKYNNILLSMKSAELLFRKKEVEWKDNLKKIKLQMNKSKETKQNRNKIISDLYKTLEEQSDFIKNNYQSLDFSQKSDMTNEAETEVEKYDEKGILLAILETLNELKHVQKQQTHTHSFLFKSMQTQMDSLKQNKLYASPKDLNRNQFIINSQSNSFRKIEDIRNRARRDKRRKEIGEEKPSGVDDTFMGKRVIAKDNIDIVKDNKKKLGEIYTLINYNK